MNSQGTNKSLTSLRFPSQECRFSHAQQLEKNHDYNSITGINRYSWIDCMQRKRDVDGLTADPAAVGCLPFWRPPRVYDARIRFGRSSEVDPAPIFNPVDVDLAGRHYVQVRHVTNSLLLMSNIQAGHTGIQYSTDWLTIRHHVTSFRLQIDRRAPFQRTSIFWHSADQG